ncbi:MAG: TauD/TfdA family dioxygenase [Pseudomonadota bacterium]
MTAYRSFREQSLHYFIRPHDALPGGSIDSPAAWRGPDIAKQQDEWMVALTEDEIAELGAAHDALQKESVPLDAITRDNFVLPTLGARIAGWRDEIRNGRGFVMVRGLPVAKWGTDKAAYVYWGIGHHLGLPGAQNPQNELLGHVVDYGEEKDNPVVRRYRTTGHIDFHCDAADAVGLLCLHTAKSGGQSRIVSSVAIFNAIQQQRPDLVARLFEPFMLDRRDEQGEGESPFFPIPPCRHSDANGLQTFYHSEYFRSADRHGDVTIDTAAMELLDLYDSLCLSPELQLDMWLEQGDMQFISNHTVVHSRTAYEDWPERERKRHLLRLWLSFEDPGD